MLGATSFCSWMTTSWWSPDTWLRISPCTRPRRPNESPSWGICVSLPRWSPRATTRSTSSPGIWAVCSMRREDVLAVGMYDEKIRFYGCEDHIFADRLKRRDVRIVFAPEARALHHDSVAVSWYRAKMHETARDGIPVLLRHAPEFLDQTGFADLMPVDWSRDRPGRVARKLLIRAVLTPPVIRIL